MKQPRTYRALALALLSFALTGAPAMAAGQASCSVFTASMVDAAALASGLSNVDPPTIIVDDPMLPHLECFFTTSQGFFQVIVENAPGAGQIVLQGESNVFGDSDTRLLVGQFDQSRPEFYACRSQVLQTLVWNTYCAPHL